MRRNLFLHFLNRDTREIFGVYDSLPWAAHQRLLRRTLNAAVALCEDHCIAPPGFIVEDQIVFELAEAQRAYLRNGILQFPMRENSLAEFAEKKRIGYEPMRNRYSGLFDDTRIGFLGENATGIIRRRTHITENILKDWQAGPEEREKAWQPVKKLLLPSQVDIVSKIPVVLNERGTALTWSAIQPQLGGEARIASTELRDVLQHVYFRQYCKEFGLIVLTDLPHMPQDFMLPREGKVYSYRRLEAFLDVFGIKELILDGPSDLIVELRKRAGFISLMDAYAGLASIANSDTDLKFYADRARHATHYDWTSIAQRRMTMFDVSPVEIAEIDDVFEEAAGTIVRENSLPVRTKTSPPHDTSRQGRGKIQVMSTNPELVIFVALSEELDVLTKELKLKRNPTRPEASGEINETSVHVICPRNMGRVAAAVSMTRYLATRESAPKLILILGIAGGFAENGSQEGHIVCATKVVDLAIRKVIEDEKVASPNFRREDYRMDGTLENFIQSDDFDIKKWSNDACELDWPKDRRPSIHYGPMASADEIVSSDEWRKQMLNGVGGDTKLLGVEMEAGGVCAAAQASNIKVCMLRTITDKADPSKADNDWRTRGMRTLAHLINRLPIAAVIKSV